MRYNVVQITDSRGRSFQLEIWTPSTWTRVKVWKSRDRFKNSDWRSLDKGFLSVNEGDAWRTNESFPNVYKDADLWLGKPGANGINPSYYSLHPGLYGIVLSDYDDATQTNNSGEGEILQAWALQASPGPMTWKLASEQEVVGAAVLRGIRETQGRGK